MVGAAGGFAVGVAEVPVGARAVWPVGRPVRPRSGWGGAGTRAGSGAPAVGLG